MLARRILNTKSLGNMAIRQYTKSAVTSEKLSYTEHQATLNRPVSPHVTIYAFPSVAIASITGRVTGVMSAAGVSGIGCATAVGVDVGEIATMLSQTPVAPLFKFCVAFPLVYHWGYCVRHIIWDRAPDTLTNEEVEKSSMALGAAAVALSGGLMLM